MKLSIIVPVWRVEETLDRCVKSIVAQLTDDMEVILVDDGSPDRCPQMCDEWAARDSHIRVLHKSNGGLSSARNAGLDVATGDYVTFVDSDDFVALETYPSLLALLDKYPDTDLLEFPVYWHYGAPNQRIQEWGRHRITDMRRYWLRHHAYEHAYNWNKLFRRSLFDTLRYPEGVEFEDIATLPERLQQVKSVLLTNKGLYYYSDNPQGITRKATSREAQMMLNHHLKAIEIFDALGDARYYATVLNRQMDVFELTGRTPQLPYRRQNPLAWGLSMRDRVKLLLLNLIGIEKLCRINRYLHKKRQPR